LPRTGLALSPALGWGLAGVALAAIMIGAAWYRRRS
jgi:hypothetical protein